MKNKLTNTDWGERYTFHATFERYSFTSGNRGIQTLILFNNVTDEYSRPLLDNCGVCFDDLKCFRELNLEEGDRITFNARKLKYMEVCPDVRYGETPKRYLRLFYPTKVEKLYSPVRPLHSQNEFKIKVPTV